VIFRVQKSHFFPKSALRVENGDFREGFRKFFRKFFRDERDDRRLFTWLLIAAAEFKFDLRT
jgi:hypothetical protein